MRNLLFILTILFSNTILAQNHVGINTTNPQAALHVADSNFLIGIPGQVSFGVVAPAPIQGQGRRLMWIGGLAAFRAGQVAGKEWDTDSIGAGSFAIGSSTKATGIASFAGGAGSLAQSDYDFAYGYTAKAIGGHSTALGYGSIAIGSGSTSIGNSNKAIGNNAVSMGWDNDATGNNSIAMGFNSTAAGDYSTVIGSNNNTLNDYALATGLQTTASGYATTAMGSQTSAIGYYSTALGLGTKAYTRGSISIGMFNASYPGSPLPNFNGSTDRIFEIGNGESDNVRSNAITVLRNGRTGIGVLDPEFKLDVNGRVRLTHDGNSAGIWYNNSSNSLAAFAGLKTDNQWGIYGNSAWRFYFDYSTNEAYKTSGSSSWVIASDARLKENVHPYTDGLKEVMQIDPVWFNYKQNSGFSTAKPYIGVIAQELQKTAPYMVGTFKKDDKELFNVDNSAMTYMLINAVKEQQNEIELLRKKNEELELLKKRVEQLEQKINQ
ncbi:tail fiber domain-containing protein [Ferruginibacter sp. SUN002]|uniref:tail fiber domain-containing protein n=1 Tax=Ferruginibacter sp. SUN002 TaxID=2937789 RepID=UPI003D35C1A9